MDVTYETLKLQLNQFVSNTSSFSSLTIFQGVEKGCIGNEWVKLLLLWTIGRMHYSDGFRGYGMGVLKTNGLVP